MSDYKNRETKKDQYDNRTQLSQAGKTPEEMNQYLISGESDDLSEEFSDKL